MTRIVSVSSSRADVGVLSAVWTALAATSGAELHLFLTGMHRAAGAPAVAAPPNAVVHSGGDDLGGTGAPHAAAAMAAIARAAGALYADLRPDAILLTGDRLDMCPAAMASLPFNIALVHLHGGEVTEGAIDDRIRHATSKLAHSHCVASSRARTRLLAMGVADATIHVTGGPGLDALRAAPELTPAEFVRAAGLDGVEGASEALRLVTVHPETNAVDPLAPCAAVLDALAARPAPTLFTAPNSDPCGAEMRRRIADFTARHRWARFRDTLGTRLYASALRHAAVMVGNSSSGLIEAGLFGLPAVNVGDRQKGRERGVNVIDVANEAAAVGAALDRLGARPARCAPGSPYGDGNAGPRVAAVVSAVARDRHLAGAAREFPSPDRVAAVGAN